MRVKTRFRRRNVSKYKALKIKQTIKMHEKNSYLKTSQEDVPKIPRFANTSVKEVESNKIKKMRSKNSAWKSITFSRRILFLNNGEIQNCYLIGNVHDPICKIFLWSNCVLCTRKREAQIIKWKGKRET